LAQAISALFSRCLLATKYRGMETWQKLLLAAGGAVGAAAVLYYLLSEEEEGKAEEAEVETVAKTKLTKQELVEILKEQIVEMKKTHASATEVTKEISKEMEAVGGDLPMNKLLDMMKAPEDPIAKLAARGLEMETLDNEIARHQNDPEVMGLVQQFMMMGQDEQEMKSQADSKSSDLTVDKIVEIMKFQVEAMEKFAADLKDFPDKKKYDPQSIMQAAMAVPGAKVIQKFGIAEKELQTSIMRNQGELRTSREFNESIMKQQGVLQTIVSALGMKMGP